MNFFLVNKRKLLTNAGKDVVLVLLGILIALSIVEVVIRVYNPLGFRIRGDKIVLPVDRIQVIHNKEGSRFDKLVVNKKNSLGFRGEEPPADFNDWLTVVTVGGSTTECFALNENKSWPYILGNKLNKSFPKLWLNNAGFGGQSTFGHIVLMRDFLIKLRPKSVIFLVGTNDVGRGGFSIQDKNLFGINNFRILEKALITMANHSEVCSVLLNLYRFYFPVSITDLGDIGEIDIRTLKQREISAATEKKIIESHEQKYLPYYRQRLEKLINLAQENQIDPVLITQPMLYGDAIDDVTGVNLHNIIAYGDNNGGLKWKLMELYNDVTRQVGKERGVLVIDLARRLPKSSRYFYDLSHYSNEGAAKVAAIIYSRLLPYYEKKYPLYYQPMSQASH
jgi:lysophospholipase L1-like esterase